MSRSQIIRIMLGILFLGGVFLLPYWLVILSALLTACFIPYYVEFVIIIVAEEILYHNTSNLSENIIYPILLISLFVVIEASRNIVRERFFRM